MTTNYPAVVRREEHDPMPDRRYGSHIQSLFGEENRAQPVQTYGDRLRRAARNDNVILGTAFVAILAAGTCSGLYIKNHSSADDSALSRTRFAYTMRCQPIPVGKGIIVNCYNVANQNGIVRGEQK